MDGHYKITVKIEDTGEKLSKQAKDWAKEWASSVNNNDMEYIRENIGEKYYPPWYTPEMIHEAEEFGKGNFEPFLKRLKKEQDQLKKSIGVWGDAIVDRLDTSLTKDEKSEVNARGDNIIRLITDYKTDVYHTSVNDAWGFDKDNRYQYMGQLDDGIHSVKVIKSATQNPK